MSDKCARLAQYDWSRCFPDFVPIALPDLITRVYDRKVKMDNVFDDITYDTTFKKKWVFAGIQGVAYGNLHLIESTEERTYM